MPSIARKGVGDGAEIKNFDSEPGADPWLMSVPSAPSDEFIIGMEAERLCTQRSSPRSNANLNAAVGELPYVANGEEDEERGSRKQSSPFDTIPVLTPESSPKAIDFGRGRGHGSGVYMSRSGMDLTRDM